ncbi:MAG: hypothetical protein JXA30_16165 [Deltaproteobacteria bacterium]|nr:hypothetical protein [Deltaproteobacteria bacterium]
MKIGPFVDKKSRKLNVWVAASFTCAIALIAVQPVHAQRDSSDQSATMMDTSYNLKFMLGLAGEAEIEGEVDGLPGGASVDDDLEPTLGGGFEVDFPLHEYFLLGGMFSFHAWITDTGDDLDIDRNYLLDFSLVPKGRYPFKGSPFAIYLGLPIGFTLGFFDEENAEAAFPLLGSADVDVGFGMNLSVLVGAQVNLASSFGLMFEIGYTYRYCSYDGELTDLGLSGEAEIETEQLALNLGFYFM